MRVARVTWIVFAGLVLLVATSTTQAFHDGGVAECAGCHSMHNPNQGGGSGSDHLLIAYDESSVCLSCHITSSATPSSYHVATADSLLGPGMSPTQRTPGGDFGWLKKTYSWAPSWNPSAVETEEGYTHGHNIVADDYGYIPDGINTIAPGGTMLSDQLGCESCHDPHGTFRRDESGSYVVPAIGTTVAPIVASGSYHNSPTPGAGEAVGSYRLLAGPGYGDFGAGNLFTVDPPMAIAPSSYNRTEASTQTLVAYGQGMSDWCATCHPNFHTATAPGAFLHPTNQSINTGTPSVRSIYNAYVSSGDLSGTQANSYLSLVPYEEVALTWSELQTLVTNNTAQTNIPGPDDNEYVMCLSCHRAHASGWEYAVRWNAESEFLTYGGVYPGTDTSAPSQFSRGRTSAEMQAAYYDRPPTEFATYQRSLCNKCHAKD
ncbi:MAG TPA: hypothetical protein VD788_13875 [Candidatus Polarisedimenticolaceae bacterium]|nr:hypothetical protein [Candidatus Polarisedimenticolaceae bacterium]